jgi:hypothetical protein
MDRTRSITTDTAEELLSEIAYYSRQGWRMLSGWQVCMGKYATILTMPECKKGCRLIRKGK